MDRAVDKGPLRPAQEEVLKEWFSKFRNEKDTILKLHTGQGKTLVGLLMLQSYINEGKGPVVFLCPDNFLVDQTCIQAKQFGIQTCKAVDELPDEFLNSKKILVTSVQKMFNGLTKFGLGKNSKEIGIVLMDDAHSCADSIREACRIRIGNDEPAYHALKTLFSKELEEQGAGTFADIENKKKDVFLPVPYWIWHDRNSDVAKILSNESDRNSIKFAWPLLKDILENCTCIISGTAIEIEPRVPPLHEFGSYWKAKHRIFMSATVTDDSFLIKGLQLAATSISSPLTYAKERWSGEKMVLLPILIHEDLNREWVVSQFGPQAQNRPGGIVTIIPGFSWSKDWKQYGAFVANKEQISERLEFLKMGHYADTLVLANRYDGIDLPDSSCRILILDSKPYSENLIDHYEEGCRPNSDGIIVKTLRTIEQGMGRSVRGEKDYSVVIAIGSDLTRILRENKTRKFLSAQMEKQIEIGLAIANMAQGDLANGESPSNVFYSLIRQCIQREEGWKRFYNQEMSSMSHKGANEKLLKSYSIELIAENEFMKGNYGLAIETIQKGLDQNDLDSNDRGWYLQDIARYLYCFDKPNSSRQQVAAFRANNYLLRPPGLITVSQLTIVSQERMERIITWIKKHQNYTELQLEVNDILNKLSFGVKADTFEYALNDLSFALGFVGERPDKQWKEGPDNLWAIDDSSYILWECKNEVETTRAEINKRETEQMNRSAAWFEKHYPMHKVTRIVIHPSKTVESAGAFTSEVIVMRVQELAQLCKSVKNFFKSFENKDFSSLSEKNIQDLINANKLNGEDIVSLCQKIKNRKAER